MYILIYDKEDISFTYTLTKEDKALSNSGYQEIISIQDPDNPKIYREGMWEPVKVRYEEEED